MKSCKNCGHTDEKTNCTSDFLEPEDPKDFCANWVEPRAKTGRDLLMAMTNEEIGESVTDLCCICAFKGDRKKCRDIPCAKGIVEWLEQEAPNA